MLNWWRAKRGRSPRSPAGLADPGCPVIARNRRAGTTLAHVAEESGWSIGSIRYYFPNKDELVASALWRVGERVDERVRNRTAGGVTGEGLRGARARPPAPA